MAKVEPRLLEVGQGRGADSKGAVVQRAVLYGELEAHPGWRDLVARVEKWRTQLLEDLRWGHLRQRRIQGVDLDVTDDDIRAMLYMLGLVLDIPAAAKTAYEQLRQLEDEAARRVAAAEQRFGGGLEAE